MLKCRRRFCGSKFQIFLAGIQVGIGDGFYEAMFDCDIAQTKIVWWKICFGLHAAPWLCWPVSTS
jgi:hypothetical protein